MNSKWQVSDLKCSYVAWTIPMTLSLKPCSRTQKSTARSFSPNTKTTTPTHSPTCTLKPQCNSKSSQTHFKIKFKLKSPNKMSNIGIGSGSVRTSYWMISIESAYSRKSFLVSESRRRSKRTHPRPKAKKCLNSNRKLYRPD